MCISALQRLELGMNLDLNFKLDDYTDSIFAKAKVVWQDTRDNVYYPFAVGLKFFKIDSADSRRIHNYVVKASHKEAEATKINR